MDGDSTSCPGSQILTLSVNFFFPSIQPKFKAVSSRSVWKKRWNPHLTTFRWGQKYILFQNNPQVGQLPAKSGEKRGEAGAGQPHTHRNCASDGSLWTGSAFPCVDPCSSWSTAAVGRWQAPGSSCLSSWGCSEGHCWTWASSAPCQCRSGWAPPGSPPLAWPCPCAASPRIVCCPPALGSPESSAQWCHLP